MASQAGKPKWGVIYACNEHHDAVYSSLVCERPGCVVGLLWMFCLMPESLAPRWSIAHLCSWCKCFGPGCVVALLWMFCLMPQSFAPRWSIAHLCSWCKCFGPLASVLLVAVRTVLPTCAGVCCLRVRTAQVGRQLLDRLVDRCSTDGCACTVLRRCRCTRTSCRAKNSMPLCTCCVPAV
jgi:hypothetical protein